MLGPLLDLSWQVREAASSADPSFPGHATASALDSLLASRVGPLLQRQLAGSRTLQAVGEALLPQLTSLEALRGLDLGLAARALQDAVRGPPLPCPLALRP